MEQNTTIKEITDEPKILNETVHVNNNNTGQQSAPKTDNNGNLNLGGIMTDQTGNINKGETMNNVLQVEEKKSALAPEILGEPLIKVSGCGEYFKYGQKLGNISEIQYPNKEVSLEGLRNSSDTISMMTMGFNASNNYIGKVRFRPNIYNFTISEKGPQYRLQYYWNNLPDQYRKYSYDKDQTSIQAGQNHILTMIKNDAQIVVPNQYAGGVWNYNHDQPIHLPNNAICKVLRFDSYPLYDPALCYTTEAYKAFSLLNKNINAPNDIFTGMIRSNAQNLDIRMRDAIVTLWNHPVPDPVAYSPIIYQLKLALYTEALVSLYSMVENYNSASFAPIMLDPNKVIHIREVENANLDVSRQFNLTWMTLDQYNNYLYTDIELDARIRNEQYEFIPIKYEWISKPYALTAYLVSILPYPLVSIRGFGVETIGIADNGWGYSLNRNVILESLNSRIEIQGHRNIILVVYDAETNMATQPTVGGQINPDYVEPEINVGGGVYHIPNAVYGRAHDPNNPGNEWPWDNFRQWVIPSLIHMLEQQDVKYTLLARLEDLLQWHTYVDIYKFIAMLTATHNGAYSNNIGPVDGNNEWLHQTCFLSPYHNVGNRAKINGYIQEPTFYQKLMMQLGFIKQKDADFIKGLNPLQIANMMYHQRVGYTVPAAKLLQENELRINWGIEFVDDIRWQRRMEASNMILNNFQISNLILDKNSHNQWVHTNVTTQDMWFQEGKTNINEYIGTLDWLSMWFSQEYIIKKQTIHPINEEMLKSISGVASSSGHDIIISHEFNKASHNALNVFMDKFYRRTLAKWDRNVEWDASNINRNVIAMINRSPIFQPVWCINQLTFMADRNVRLNMYYTSGMYVSNNNSFEIGPCPWVRVLNYQYPSQDDDTHLPISPVFPHDKVNEIWGDIIYNHWDAFIFVDDTRFERQESYFPLGKSDDNKNE